jgi:Tol biopolymer transport system component/DNA-binding winged helix-turn-helix (wHTH) protein
MSQQNHFVYEFGPFHLDATKRALLKEGEPLKLFPKEFDTLLALVERSGELLEKDDLMRTVWHDAIVEESNLTTNISHLRKILGETRDKHDYIVTVPGRGYRFVAGVTQTFDEVIVRERTRLIVEEENGSNSVNIESFASPDQSNRQSQQSQIDELAHRRFPEIKSIVGSHGAERDNRVRAAPMIALTPRLERKTLQFWLTIGTVLVSLTTGAFFLYKFLRPTTPSVLFQNVTLKQLTSNGRATHATLSPDGKLFVYASRDAGKEGLWLSSVSGGETVCLRRNEDVTYRSLNFSPDGSSVFYVAFGEGIPGGALFRIPVLGGVPEKLRDNIHVTVAFAPDMKRFAYTRWDRDSKASALMIADTNGSYERPIATRPENLPFRSLSPSWSPDGTKIAIAASTDESGETYEVFVVSVGGGQIKPLTTLSWFHVASTAWLPDMSGLVVVAKEKGVWDGFQLWNVSYPEGTARRILADLDNYGPALTFSSDGQFLTAIQEQRVTDVWVAKSGDLARSRQITFSSVGRRDGWNNLAWTPDDKLIYGAILRDSLTLWTMDADGQNQKQLTSSGYRDSNVSLTADGRYMVFQSNRSGEYEIWRARTDGSEMKQLTSGGRNKEPQVSPDGKWVVYTSLREGLWSLWRISIDGGKPGRITNKPSSSAAFSHDGKLIACAYTAQSDSQTQLAVIPAEGGLPLKLFDVPRLANFGLGVRWTPDDKGVTYRDWSNGIWRQPINGVKPERLKGLPEEKLYAYAWSRDGNQFAFVRGSEIRDVVLLRNNK